MSIFRSKSWPLLLGDGGTARNCIVPDLRDKEIVHQDIEKKLDNEKATRNEIKPEGTIDNADKRKQSPASSQVRARKLLCRHYYPEGGWGWVITVVGTLAHLLGSGLQLSAPAALTIPASIKFHHQPIHTAGMKFMNVHRTSEAFQFQFTKDSRQTNIKKCGKFES